MLPPSKPHKMSLWCLPCLPAARSPGSRAPLRWPPPAAIGQSEKPLSRIAFGSCAKQTLRQPIWDPILAYRPDLFIFAGDNVYGDFNSPDAADLKRAYEEASRIAGYAKLRETVPHLAVWDDHDYGVNDGGAEFAHKTVAKSLFLDFWKVPAGDIPPHTGVASTIRGSSDQRGKRVQVILLDVRWFRSPLRITDQRGAPGKQRYLPDPDPAKDDAGSRAMGVALGGTAQTRGVAPDRVEHAGPCRRPWLGTLEGTCRWRRRSWSIPSARLGPGASSSCPATATSARSTARTPEALHPLYEVTSSGLNMVYWAAKEPGTQPSRPPLRRRQFRRGRNRLVDPHGPAGATRRQRRHAACGRYSFRFAGHRVDAKRACLGAALHAYRAVETIAAGRRRP